MYRTIATHLIHKAGFQLKEASTGAVTLIQGFGWSGTPGALNLNIHGHLLVLEGVYYINQYGNPVFHRVKAPDRAERHAAMTGFCSCKTGIHAIHGNNLGAKTQARVQPVRVRIDIEACGRWRVVTAVVQ